VIACDLHPRFTTTRLAREWSEELGVPLVQVQHHHAHGAALMGEHGLDEIIAIVCDGYGYGLGGEVWGGEALHCNNEGKFRRVGHLKPQPMIGGDLATRYPLRMAAGILSKTVDIEEWLRSNCSHLPHGEQEVEVILQQSQKGSALLTSSFGRVLDAVSAVLGVCYERTYEGEPAMKLEAAAANGKDVLKFRPEVKDNIVDTSELVRRIFERRKTGAACDLAFSAERCLAEGLAQVAVDQAKHEGVEVVGFSGGVAYNEHITYAMKRFVEKKGLRFVVHKAVPAGDGGVSFGQSLAAIWQMREEATKKQ
jgi:hydrogenase maturation protein HypF